MEYTISKKFKDLEVHYGRVDIVGMELDIYIPSLRLAFEINGIVHKKAIYGQEKLDRVKKNDALKAKRCAEKNIDLVVVDISDMPSIKSYHLPRHTESILSEIRKRLS